MKYADLKHIILFILLHIPLLNTAQTNIDSLKNLFKKASGQDKINVLIQLSKAHKRTSPEKTVEYALEAYRLALKQNDKLLIANSLENAGDGELLLGNLDTAESYYKRSFSIYDKLDNFEGLAESYLDLGNIYFFNSNYDSAAIYYQKSIGFKIDLGDNLGLINLYNNLGAVYKKTGQTELAIEALQNSIKICEQLNKPEKKGLALINLASLYFTQGELSESMQYNFDALNIAIKTNDLYTKSNAFTNLGNIYSFIEDYDKALEYQRKALEIDVSLKDWEGIIAAHNNIGSIYLDMKKLDSAEYYFSKSLSLHQSKNVKIEYETTTFNIGQVNKKRGDYKKALEYYNESLNTSTEINDVVLIINTRMAIGEIYLIQGDIAKAEKNLMRALSLIKNNPLKDEYKIYSLLSKLYQKKNELNKALAYQIKYANLKDSAVNLRQTITLSEIRSSYEIQKQQEQINLLSKDSKLQQERIQKQKTFRNFLIAGTSVILILLIFQFINFKNKQKSNKILQKQNEEIKHKNLEIKQKTEHLTNINKELEKLSIAASRTDNAILIVTPQGKIEWINEGHTRLYGYTLEEFIRLKGDNYIKTSSNTNIEEIFSNALTEKKSQKYESNIISKEGTKYSIHTTLTPIINDNKEVVRLIAIDSDVTKQKQVEKELQELLVTKDKFFSIIAHDLKNPFNSLIGLAQLLVHGYDRLSPEKVKYFHRNLYQISKNGYELLINLLEWSRSQMGTIQFKPVELNLAALVEETFSLYSSKAAQKEITLTNNTDENSTILADQNMLKTILRNLVSNALKFTGRGGAIEISEKNIDGYKEVSVRDTGIGIETQDIQKLFRLEENYTTEGTEDETGTGLGLILCKEFIEKHGGEIAVESKVGFGSKFIFTLPKNN